MFCRSSDLLKFTLPSRTCKGAVARGDKVNLINELTAAGLFGTFTRFPFHPQFCNVDKKLDGTKHCKYILLVWFSLTILSFFESLFLFYISCIYTLFHKDDIHKPEVGTNKFLFFV